METDAAGPGVPLIAAAIALSALALIADGTGEIDDLARESTRQALDSLANATCLDEDEFVLALGLLLPASTTLALLAPGSDQAALLAALLAAPGAQAPLTQHFPALGELARTMARAPVAGAALVSAPKVMAALVSEEAWRRSFSEASKRIDDWRAARAARTFRYSGATDVWQELLRATGILGPVLQAAAQAQLARADEVRRFVQRDDLEARIRTVERQVRGAMSARRAPIEGPAWRELTNAVEEGLALLRGWVASADAAPSRSDAARDQSIANLRRDLLSRIGAARQQLAMLSGTAAAAATIADQTLVRLLHVLEGQVPQRAAPTVAELLGRDLLPVTAIRFQIGWARPRPLDAALRPALLALAQSPPPPAAIVARQRIADADYLGADLAIGLATEDAGGGGLHRELRNALERRKSEEIVTLDRVRSSVEEAERAGRLETGQAQELLERLQRCHTAMSDARPDEAEARFAEAREQVVRAEEAVKARADAARSRILLRSGQLRGLAEAERERIDQLLHDGQFALAEDLVERTEAGEALEPSQSVPVEQAFDDFFPLQAERLAIWLRGRRTAMREIADHGLPALAELRPAGQPAPDDLPELARAWADCAGLGVRNGLKDGLLRLFSGLGFTDPELPTFSTPPRDASEITTQLRVRPLRDRDTSVLPQFGSEAGGAYRLLCLWRKRDEDEIKEALASAVGGGQPTLIIFFGPLDQEQRRRLAGLARAGKLPATIVIDEVLMLHLALLSDRRLPALFACTLPFTDTRPWADTGTPAPEMFFGRARELRAVAESGGDFTHLIYGGRQLGKTAVLRQVERTAAAQHDTVARYISIAEIGLTQPTSELWSRLADELRASVPMPPTAGEREVRRAVLEWLLAKPSRRMLLLLDEADDFFRKDREAKFPVTAALRDMAVTTDRRFKPVFAGLRNVQKLARDPNSPLAHLGMPLVVGPLLRGEERRQAEALVRWPFAALGYRMDEAVVTRILAFANYYPSLIQVVCQRLLRSLRQQGAASGPPWQVRMADVERVLDTAEVRTEAFKRFSITLELDQRYKLLTLLAANFSMDEPGLLASGIDRATLRDLAAAAWPAGFPVTLNDDAFEALLDEVVGLGLLRGVGGTHYALRSANLAHLIGTQDEIRRQIEGFAKRPAEEISDPLDLRRFIERRPGLLTFRQEGYLLDASGGIAILAGTRLAGIDAWDAAVRAACLFARERHKIKLQPRPFGPPYTFERFEALLASIPGERRSVSDPFVVVVPPAAPWDASWVRAAERRCLTRTKGAAPVRVLFVADAARAWGWVSDPERLAVLRTGEIGARVLELTAGPWSRTDIDL